MKRLILLGATGSIGIQTLDVVNRNSDKFSLVGLSVGENIKLLKEILNNHKLEHICVRNKEDYDLLCKEYPLIKFYYGDEGLIDLVNLKEYDLLVNALVGFVGFKPTLAAINNKKDIALANKETLVVAGELVNKAVQENNVKLFPIDSEHSAILQCLQGNDFKEVKKMIITASGGSFRKLNRRQLADVTVEDALNHPNWSMGDKITVDSATMMNKGFEVIEAHWLFNLDYDKIEVVLHDESIVHSMVEYIDGAIMAQLGSADMRLPIQYALSYPNRLPMASGFSLTDIGCLHFKKMDYERFPLLKLAIEVGKKKGNLPCALNAANEEANLAFRNKKISFLDIERVVFKCVEQCEFIQDLTLENLMETDLKTRLKAKELIKGGIK